MGQSSRHAGLELLIVFGLTLAFLFWMSDWTGFDGDDLNTVLPTMHLPEVLDGDLRIYRYAWQPLSYWISYAVYLATGSMGAIFSLAAIATAAGITMLYRVSCQILGLARLLFVPLLLLFPEILYNGFYFNATALGFPFAVLAVLLAYDARQAWGAVLSGVTLALAVLTRLDFVLIVPAIALFRLWYVRRAGDLLLVVLAGFATLALSWAVGLLPVAEIIAIYDMARTEIIEKANTPGWDATVKLFVTTTVFSPLGWLLLGVAAIWLLRQRRYWLAVVIGLICLAPLLFSARNMLTPKYMIPAFALWPVLAAIIWLRATETLTPQHRRLLSGLWVAATLFLLVFSIEPRPRPPYVTLTAQDAHQVGTHDGKRSWGAYLRQMRITTHKSFQREREKAEAVRARLMQEGEGEIVIVGGQSVFDSGGFAWRILQLELERDGIHGRVTGHHELSFDVPAGRLILRKTMPAEGAGRCVLGLDEDPSAYEDPAGWIAAHC